MARNIPSTAIAQAAITIAAIIVISDRMRQLRPEVVDELAESIKAQGLLCPILLRRRASGGLVLVAGHHRLEAARKLGWIVIPAIILDEIDADRARLAEIDENLIRAELSPAERAMHTAERKRLYGQQAAAPRHGGDRKSAKAKSSGKNCPLKFFDKKTAVKTVKSARTVRLDVQRCEACAAVLPDVIGTTLDRGDQLDALAKLPAGHQRDLVDRAKSGEKINVKNEAKKHRRAKRER